MTARRHHFALLLGAVVLSTAACPTPRAPAPPAHRRAPTPAPRRPRVDYVLRWRHAVGDLEGDGIVLGVVGKIVLVDQNDRVLSLRLTDGKQVKRLPKSGRCEGEPISFIGAACGRAVLLCEHRDQSEERRPRRPTTATLQAVDPSSGRIAWHLDGLEPCAPAIAGKRIVASSTRGLVAASACDGRVAWRVADVTSSSSPIISGDAVAVRDAAGLRAVALADGKTRWRRKLGGQDISAGADATHVYVALSSGGPAPRSRVVAARWRDGTVAWTRDLGREEPTFALLGANATLFVATQGAGDHPGHLYALAAHSGAVVWRQPVLTDSNGHSFAPRIADSDVILATALPKAPHSALREIAIRGWDARSGAVRWTFAWKKPDKYVVTPVVVVGSTILLADGHVVMALQPRPRR